MIRGTTALFKFKLPYEKESIMSVNIKFWQPNNLSNSSPIITIKLRGTSLDDCFATDKPKELCVSLRSDETLKFSDKYKGKVQLWGQLLGQGDEGATFGSRPQIFTVYPMPDDIMDPTMPGINEDGWVVLDGETI